MIEHCKGDDEIDSDDDSDDCDEERWKRNLTSHI